MTLRREVRVRGKGKRAGSGAPSLKLNLGHSIADWLLVVGSQVENPNMRFARDTIRGMYVHNLIRNQLKVAIGFN